MAMYRGRLSLEEVLKEEAYDAGYTPSELKIFRFKEKKLISPSKWAKKKYKKKRRAK